MVVMIIVTNVGGGGCDDYSDKCWWWWLWWYKWQMMVVVMIQVTDDGCDEDSDRSSMHHANDYVWWVTKDFVVGLQSRLVEVLQLTLPWKVNCSYLKSIAGYLQPQLSNTFPHKRTPSFTRVYGKYRLYIVAINQNPTTCIIHTPQKHSYNNFQNL